MINDNDISFNTVVLIPHYNNLKGLKTSITSVWHPKAIKILVVDDGSDSDQKPDIEELRKLAASNVSIDVFNLQANRGICIALNLGLEYILAHYDNKYIARLDCGDYSVRNRFLIQEDYLKDNNKIALVGSWVKFIGAEGQGLFKITPPLNHKKILRYMPVRCNFIHPTVMYRTSVLHEIGYYPAHYSAAEDYAFFYEIAKKYQTANIGKCLTYVFQDPNGISQQQRFIQNKSKLKVILKYSKLNVYSVYGVFFNIALRFFPSKIVQKTKKIIYSYQ